MNKVLLTLILSLLFLSLSAQDFEIVSVEALVADMSAREEMKTDHNDHQCALLRIATQNIAPNQREAFIFVPDLGSEVVERASRDGEIWLWVTPGLKYLRIKHREWGQYELRLFDYVSRVEALHTYKVTIKGTLTMALQEQDNPNYLPETGTVTVDDPNNTNSVNVELKPDFVENGANFVTLDLAYSPNPLLSFGATFGSVKRFGWFVSAMSNFNFTALGADQIADNQGLVDDEYPSYTGESCDTRFSIIGGVMYRIVGPLCLRAGTGLGSWTKSWFTSDGHLVERSTDSLDGFDFLFGTQLQLKGFTISLDAITINFKTIEAKIGLGYCWKRK